MRKERAWVSAQAATGVLENNHEPASPDRSAMNLALLNRSRTHSITAPGLCRGTPANRWPPAGPQPPPNRPSRNPAVPGGDVHEPGGRRSGRSARSAKESSRKTPRARFGSRQEFIWPPPSNLRASAPISSPSRPTSFARYSKSSLRLR